MRRASASPSSPRRLAQNGDARPRRRRRRRRRPRVFFSSTRGSFSSEKFCALNACARPFRWFSASSARAHDVRRVGNPSRRAARRLGRRRRKRRERYRSVVPPRAPELRSRSRVASHSATTFARVYRRAFPAPCSDNAPLENRERITTHTRSRRAKPTRTLAETPTRRSRRRNLFPAGASRATAPSAMGRARPPSAVFDDQIRPSRDAPPEAWLRSTLLVRTGAGVRAEQTAKRAPRLGARAPRALVDGRRRSALRYVCGVRAILETVGARFGARDGPRRLERTRATRTRAATSHAAKVTAAVRGALRLPRRRRRAAAARPETRGGTPAFQLPLRRRRRAAAGGGARAARSGEVPYAARRTGRRRRLRARRRRRSPRVRWWRRRVRRG